MIYVSLDSEKSNAGFATRYTVLDDRVAYSQIDVNKSQIL